MYKLHSLQDYIEENINNKIYSSYETINCGGAFGHMSHPFEDFSLTFGQIKDIIKLSLQGRLDKEIKPQEKLDGLALAISWKNNKIIAARNKTDRKSFGKDALSINDVIEKFKNHPETLRDAFIFAVTDLEKALLNLSKDDLNDIFNDGHNFMHIEILYPSHPNVISYDTAKLVFHTVTEYNEEGIPINDYPNKARKLEKIILKINSHIQNTFEITPPGVISLPKHIDFSKKQTYFINKVENLQKSAKLNNNDKISDYLYFYFKELIIQHDIDSEITQPILDGLINRWINADKTYNIRLLKNDISNQNFSNWISNFDKKESNNTLRTIIAPLEILFLELGVTILKNANGFLAVNPDEAVQKIRRDIDIAIKHIESSGDITMINTLQQQMAKIDAIGGFDSILPTEGIVFIYNGKTYKFTGAFAPVNRITGLLKF
jgi:hypothetical protein